MPQAFQTRSSSTVRAARDTAGARVPGRLGSWELMGVAGEGELAIVYRARPAGVAADQPASYAIKVLRPEWQDDPRGLAIAARELQVGRKVTNPHLIPILAGELDERPYYLVMPLLEGHTLRDRLRDQLQFDLPVAFWIVRQLTEALAALHDAGWMHADVKPSNVFVSSMGHVTLFDLGFARQVEERGSIADRAVMGTISYMAPEMLYSAIGGDIRSDVYSLGVMLFELLTGRLPFDAEDIAELATQHRQELPGDLRALVPHLPTRAARLVYRMLAKEPLRRPLPSELIDRLTALEIETFAERYSIA